MNLSKRVAGQGRFKTCNFKIKRQQNCCVRSLIRLPSYPGTPRPGIRRRWVVNVNATPPLLASWFKRLPCCRTCRWVLQSGNFKTSATLVESFGKRFSDRSSILLISTTTNKTEPCADWRWVRFCFYTRKVNCIILGEAVSTLSLRLLFSLSNWKKSCKIAVGLL